MLRALTREGTVLGEVAVDGDLVTDLQLSHGASRCPAGRAADPFRRPSSPPLPAASLTLR